MSEIVDLRDIRITIAGLGLMGGSLAMALKEQNISTTAVDPDINTIKQALDSGTIVGGTTDLREGILDADLIVLAMPVGSIIETITQLPNIREDGCIVMDLGSTKSEICDAMSLLPENFIAIGGHPMCGREKSGFGAATSDLYESQAFVLCKNKRTTELGKDMALALIEAAGALPVFLESAIHDEIVGLTSHLPYLLSIIIISQVAQEARADSNFWKISATGLRDTVRLAGSNPQMMSDILTSNRNAIVRHLKETRLNLDHLIQDLEGDGAKQLEEFLQFGKEHHDLYYKQRWAGRAENS